MSTPIYIIGDTPLAFALAAKLRAEEQNACMIDPVNPERFATPFVIRNDVSLQKQRITVPCQPFMHDEPKLVIIDIKPEHLHAYLTYFSYAKTANCPVVSFCHTPNLSYVSNILQRPILSAYFDGYVSLRGDNTVAILGNTGTLTLSINENHIHYQTLQNLLAKTYFKLNFNPNEQQNFWDFFATYASCSLFSIKHGSNIREVSKFPELRQTLNSIVEEIISAAPQDVSLNREQIISDIYSTPQEYTYPALTEFKNKRSGELLFIVDTLRAQIQNKALKLSTCENIINTAMHRILSSVE